MHDHRVNVLTVVASESYEQFVSGLQGEIEKAYGKEGLPPKPSNARAKVSLKLRKNHMLKPEFQQLWDKIKRRTRYAVTIDSVKLIADVVAEMGTIKVRRPRVVVRVAGVNAKTSEDLFEAIRLADASVVIDLEGRFPMPDLVFHSRKSYGSHFTANAHRTQNHSFNSEGCSAIATRLRQSSRICVRVGWYHKDKTGRSTCWRY